MILKNILPTTTMNSFLNYMRNIFIPTLNTSNAASGVGTVTINAKSGMATFEDIINAGATSDLIISSTFIEAGQAVNVQLYYPNNTGEEPIIIGIVVANGRVTISIKNYGLSNTSDNLVISFQIVS